MTGVKAVLGVSTAVRLWSGLTGVKDKVSPSSDLLSVWELLRGELPDEARGSGASRCKGDEERSVLEGFVRRDAGEEECTAFIRAAVQGLETVMSLRI